MTYEKYKNWIVLSCGKHGASDGALRDLTSILDLIPDDVATHVEVDDDGSITIRWWVARTVTIVLNGDGRVIGLPSDLGALLTPWVCSLRDKSALEWRLLYERRPSWEAI